MTAMPSPVSERLTAAEVELALLLHHEAAHVSTCMLFEIPFDYVTLTTGFWGGIRSGYVQVGDKTHEKVDNEIVMMFAGLSAEAVWLDRNPGYGTVLASNGGTDTAMAHQLMREHDTSSEGFLRRRTTAVVLQRWDHIEIVAAELGRRRTLTANQARRAR